MRAAAIALLLFAAPGGHAQGIITTLAGKPFVFPSGEMPPLAAPLGQITSVAVDSQGNILAADVENDIIVRITPSGALSVVASISDPWHLALDGAGTVWVRSGQRIRKLTAGGGFTEFLIQSLPGPIRHFILSFDPVSFAADAQGNLYFADPGNAQVWRILPDGAGAAIAGNGQCRFAGDGGPALAASLCEPRAVAVDRAGAVYVADSGNSRIRRIGTDGVITTIAGQGERGVAGDGGPALAARVGFIPAMTLDATDNLYFVDCGADDCRRTGSGSPAQHRVRRVDTRGVITTVAGGAAAGFTGDNGPAGAALLHDPRGLAVDAAGNLLIADQGNRRLRRVTPGPAPLMQTIAGDGAYQSRGDGGPARDASLHAPSGLALDAGGAIYFSEAASHRIRKIDGQGIISRVAGSAAGYTGDGGPAIHSFLNAPRSLAFDPNGNLYAVENRNNILRRIRRDGVIETVVPYLFDSNSDISIDQVGTIFLAQLNGIFTVNPATGASTPFPPASGATTAFITSVAAESAGNVYFGTANPQPRSCAGQLYRAGPAGPPALLYRGDCINDVAADRLGHVYVAQGSVVMRLHPDGTAARAAGRGPECGPEAAGDLPGEGGPAACATITASAIAVDAANNLLLADSERGLIRRVTPCSFSLVSNSLTIPAIAGTGAAAVRTSPGCAWSARSNATWLGVTSPPGLGDGSLYFSFAGNTGPARSGTIAVAGQTLTITQQAAAPETRPPAEPSLTRALAPGFYIVEATLAGGAAGGFWGLEVIASRGETAGGFNLGGAMSADGSRLGFGAFLLASEQAVTANVEAFPPAGGELTLRFLNAQRQVVGNPATGPPPLRVTQTLPPGFYIVEVTHTANVPVNFLLGLAAPGFSGGLNVGGYLGPGITGFGAFYLPEEQEVAIRLLGRNTYGSSGAGAMILTLRDANRNVLAVVSPP